MVILVTTLLSMLVIVISGDMLMVTMYIGTLLFDVDVKNEDVLDM